MFAGNNQHMLNYEPNVESVYTMYEDANNLYGRSMSELDHTKSSCSIVLSSAQ